MSAEVSLGWNNAKLQAGAKGAAAIVEAQANKMKSALNGIGDGLRLGAGQGIFDQAVDVVKRTTSAIFDATVNADSLQGGMEALTGSVEAANARLEQMRQLAKDPGLGFSQVVQGDIALQSVGLSADLSTRAMREFGNALAVVGKGKADLDGVLLAITQIVSKGKVSAEEINQIAERVPQIRRVMQETFGTADTEAIQKMNLPVERFIELVVNGFERTVPRALVRMQGKLDNFTDASTARIADFGIAFAEHFIGPLDEATDALERGSVHAKGFGDAMGTMTGGALELGKTLFGIAKFSLDGLGQLGTDLTHTSLGMLGFQRIEQQTQAETIRLRDASLAAARIAADLKRHQDQLADATKRVADAHAEATKRANERGKAEAELTTKIIASTNAARDAYLAERQQTSNSYLPLDKQIDQIQMQIENIDRLIDAEIKSNGSSEKSYQLMTAREKLFRSLISLSKQFNDEQSREKQAVSKDTSKREDYAYALSMYDLELAIAEAKAAGHDRQVQKLEREKAIIEEVAQIVRDTDLTQQEALARATRMVNAQEAADAKREGRNRGGNKIMGYSQTQGTDSDARTRAAERVANSRDKAETRRNMSYGSFLEVDLQQKEKFKNLFGNPPAENMAPKQNSSFDSLISGFSENTKTMLELLETIKEGYS